MELKLSDRMNGLSGSATREILKLVARPEVISFAGGLPAKEGLPKDEINSICHDIFTSEYADKVLQYGTTEGLPAMLEQGGNFLNSLGLSPKPNETLVISGGQQAIDLAFKVFLNPSDVILCENPTYLAMLQIAKTYQAKVVGVDSDENGLVIDDLKQKIKKYRPKILYVVPTFSNPTGKTYSAEIRKQIAEVTASESVIVLEDDPYSRLRFKGERVPPLKTFDKTGNVVYVTSFSKIIAPGLRVGICYGSSDIIRKLTIAKQGTDLHTSNISQAIAAEYLKRGLLYPHIKQVLPVYLERFNAMLSALDLYMPQEFTHTVPQGGLFIWGELPDYIDTVEILPEALSQNVAYIQGCEFFAEGGGRNTVRLNFSNASIERIDHGVKVLSGIFKKHIAAHR